MSSYFTTPRHDRLRAQVRKFAESEVARRIGDMETSRAVDHDLSRLIAQQGWIGATIGSEYGGGLKGSVHHPDVEEVLTPVVVGAQLKAPRGCRRFWSRPTGLVSRWGRRNQRWDCTASASAS